MGCLEAWKLNLDEELEESGYDFVYVGAERSFGQGNCEDMRRRQNWGRVGEVTRLWLAPLNLLMTEVILNIDR